MRTVARGDGMGVDREDDGGSSTGVGVWPRPVCSGSDAGQTNDDGLVGAEVWHTWGGSYQARSEVQAVDLTDDRRDEEDVGAEDEEGELEFEHLGGELKSTLR